MEIKRSSRSCPARYHETEARVKDQEAQAKETGVQAKEVGAQVKATGNSVSGMDLKEWRVFGKRIGHDALYTYTEEFGSVLRDSYMYNKLPKNND